MIGEKIKSPKKTASKVARVGGLADYIRAPERRTQQEKCVYYGGRGFLTDSAGGHRLEMIALAQDGVRSADPINHYVLSWRQGEQPSGPQVEQAVDLVLGELGLSEHQAIYGLHANTDNYHLHLVVNRVHPVTEKVTKIAGGFDIEALHRAVARVEHAQGWEPEARARYRVDDRGEVVRQHYDDEALRPHKQVRDMEHLWGEKSAERIALEEGRPLILAATSWAQLHQSLATRGMRYERKGSGAIVWVGQVAVKASRVAREAGFGRLQKRLGEYEAAPEGLEVKDRKAEALRPDHPQWASYQAARERDKQIKEQAWGTLRGIVARERAELAAGQRERRQRVLAGDWQGRGELLCALRQALAQEQRAELTRMARRHAEARDKVREHLAPWPTFKGWLKGQGKHLAAEQWRQGVTESLAPEGRPERAPEPQYRAYVADWHRQDALRRQVLERLAAKHGREVARQHQISGRRWGAAKLMMKGRVAAVLWAREARRANERDWKRLRQQHLRERRAVRQSCRPPDWTTWLQGRAARGDLQAVATLRQTLEQRPHKETTRDRHPRRPRAIAEHPARTGTSRYRRAAPRGRGPRASQPNPAVTRAGPTAGPPTRLRQLSEIALARLAEIPELLLHRHARGDVEQRRPRAAAHRQLRRGPERLAKPQTRGRRR